MSTSRATVSTARRTYGKRYREATSDLLGKREVNSRGYCSSFNFKGADQPKKVGRCPAAKRDRVHLHKMWWGCGCGPLPRRVLGRAHIAENIRRSCVLAARSVLASQDITVLQESTI